MKRILLIESSPRESDSYSHHAARSIVNELQRRNPVGRRFDIAGDELTGDQAAAILSKVTGREIRLQSSSPAENQKSARGR